MEFAITFKGDIDPRRTVALCKQAEEAGFTYAWFFDSHVLWRECFVTMAMCIEHTSKLRFGPCVTNPGVRDWSVAASLYATLAQQSGGRVDIGIGRGDSSRRVMGRKPLNVETMVEFAESVRKMVRGDAVKYDEELAEVQIPWANGYELPVWFAAYGPKALAAAGEYGNGLIIQLADPWLVNWFTDQARVAGQSAGRDMSTFRVMSAAPVWVGDMKKAREQTRWFPAMVGNHVADLVERYGKSGQAIPQRLHADKDADHLGFITDDIIDSFGVLGPVEAHIEKLKELESVGVTQFNIYLMCGDEERMVEEYGKHVLPRFQRVESTK
jgi:probable F420-dependent oxidoreductase